jgi:hypothetical protein
MPVASVGLASHAKAVTPKQRSCERGPVITQGGIVAMQKSLRLPGGRKVELSGDVFNLFNVAAATGFLSTDVRSSLFAQPTNYVPARVGQIGIRMTF